MRGYLITQGRITGQTGLGMQCLPWVSCLGVRLTDSSVLSLRNLDWVCSLQTLMPSSVPCYPLSFHKGQVSSRLCQEPARCVYHSMTPKVSLIYKVLELCVWCRHELKSRRELRRNQVKLFKVLRELCFPVCVFCCHFHREFNSHVIVNVHVHCKLSPHFRSVEKLGGESLSGISQHFGLCLQKKSEYRDKLL